MTGFPARLAAEENEYWMHCREKWEYLPLACELIQSSPQAFGVKLDPGVS